MAGGVGSYREDRVGGDGGPGCAGLAAWLASIEHLGSVHDERLLLGGAAAGGSRARLHPAPWPAEAPRGPGLTFSVAVSSYGQKPRFRTGRKGWVSMPTQREEDEAKIRQQVDKIVAGIRAKDLDGLRRLYATDVVSFDVEPPLQHVGIEAKLKNWAKAFTFFQDVDYEVRDLAVTVGDDVAFGHAFGRLSGTLKDGTATSGIWVRGTFCFRKLDRNWLIVHDQASVPFDIASGKGVTDLEP